MKIEKTEYSYQITECDLKFGEQITLDGELLIPASVLNKIRAEIKGWQDDIHDNEYDADKYDFVFERIFEIIDKYRESEDKDV